MQRKSLNVCEEWLFLAAESKEYDDQQRVALITEAMFHINKLNDMLNGRGLIVGKVYVRNAAQANLTSDVQDFQVTQMTGIENITTSNPASLNCTNALGATPIYQAVANKRPAVIAEFLRLKAAYADALCFAVTTHPEAIQTFIDAKVELNVVDSKGKSLLMHALSANKAFDKIRLLVKAGVNAGRALDVAMDNANVACIALSLALGAETKNKNELLQYLPVLNEFYLNQNTVKLSTDQLENVLTKVELDNLEKCLRQLAIVNGIPGGPKVGDDEKDIPKEKPPIKNDLFSIFGDGNRFQTIQVEVKALADSGALDHTYITHCAAKALGVSEFALRKSELLETSALHHAHALDPKLCKTLTPQKNVSGNASYDIKSEYGHCLWIEYRNLREQEVRELCAAYQSYYSSDAVAKVIALRKDDGDIFQIHFDLITFVAFVLPGFKGKKPTAKIEEVKPSDVVIADVYAVERPHPDAVICSR